MPKGLELYLGYHIYFWSNENNEPIHVHVSKNPQQNATKFWITSDSVEIANDTGSVDQKDMGKILRYLRKNRDDIIVNWINYFKKGEMKR